MTEKKKNYSIGELASEFDVTTRSIRFYEDQGLLRPTRRGQTRIYTGQDRVRMKLILRGKRLGFSLAEIRDIFSLWDETPSGSEKQLNLLLETIQRKRSELEQQLKDIAIAQVELDTAESRCRDALAELETQKQTQKQQAS